MLGVSCTGPVSCARYMTDDRIGPVPMRVGCLIERILQINELRTVTKEVVEAAWESMVIGPL